MPRCAGAREVPPLRGTLTPRCCRACCSRDGALRQGRGAGRRGYGPGPRLPVAGAQRGDHAAGEEMGGGGGAGGSASRRSGRALPRLLAAWKAPHASQRRARRARAPPALARHRAPASSCPPCLLPSPAPVACSFTSACPPMLWRICGSSETLSAPRRGTGGGPAGQEGQPGPSGRMARWRRSLLVHLGRCCVQCRQGRGAAEKGRLPPREPGSACAAPHVPPSMGAALEPLASAVLCLLSQLAHPTSCAACCRAARGMGCSKWARCAHR